MINDPALALDDIQGVAVPGFFKPHQALLSLRLPHGSALHRIVKVLLELLDTGRITSGAHAFSDRAFHRNGWEGPPVGPLVAVGLSAGGVDRLRTMLAQVVPSVAFRNGMPSRAGLLGDPDPQAWSVGGSRVPELVLVVAGNNPETVRLAVDGLQRRLVSRTFNPMIAPPQYGNVLPRKARGKARSTEHFGFADGVSQPGIRGSWNGDAITQRKLHKDDPEHDLFGHPGQHLVWPGEFVLGYPASSPDPRLPGPVRQVPVWMHNGSFLVYRRLRQDVEAFKCFLKDEAARIALLPGFSGMNDDRLAAMLVGRWPSGAPLARAPKRDNPALGRERLMNNDFRFDDASPRRSLPKTVSRPLRQLGPAPADILGQICPVASHIRKVNLRDQASDMGGASATQSRRILRVGVPYDDTPTDEHGRPGQPDRGLLFLSIQASIEDQFEFLQARWINNRVRPRGPGGNDMIVGQCAASPDGKRQCVVFGDGGAQAVVETDQDFVTMTGGGYFFVPSLPTLRDLLKGALPPG